MIANLLAILLIASSILVITANDEADLEIHNTFKPENCDRKARVTDLITLHYKGSLAKDGQVFDSSYERNEPFTFQLGIGQVIKGWEKGLLDVCAGEKRKLVIPPSLGYGDMKNERIPPHSTLIFELEIIKVEDGPKPVNVFKEMDSDNDQRLSRKEVRDYLKKQMQHSQQFGDGATSDDPDLLHMVDEIFMHEDKDKDDFIAHDEFSGPKYDHDEL